MLYIMRHGKTGWNALHKIQGRRINGINKRTAKIFRAEDHRTCMGAC